MFTMPRLWCLQPSPPGRLRGRRAWRVGGGESVIFSIERQDYGSQARSSQRRCAAGGRGGFGGGGECCYRPTFPCCQIMLSEHRLPDDSYCLWNPSPSPPGMMRGRRVWRVGDGESADGDISTDQTVKQGSILAGNALLSKNSWIMIAISITIPYNNHKCRCKMLHDCLPS